MTLEIENENAPDIHYGVKKVIPARYFRPDGLILSEVTSGEEYFEVGYRIKVAKKCSSVWMRQWREYGERCYGEEFVKDTEKQIDDQLILALGLPPEQEKTKLNEGLGKGTAIVTIQGIRQSFDIWRRKVAVDKWNTNDRKKACELLRPMVEFYDHLLAEAAK
jgi:hypothetical protein